MVAPVSCLYQPCFTLKWRSLGGAIHPPCRTISGKTRSLTISLPVIVRHPSSSWHIINNLNQIALYPESNAPENGLHGGDRKTVKYVAHLFPKRPFAPSFPPCLTEQPAAQLLRLIHQKGQHHQCYKDSAQVLLAQPVIVPEVIALIFLTC